MSDRWVHVDHPDDERFDAITIDIEPRWKESELSGDEYRFSYVTTAWRKGEAIIQRGTSRLEWAIGNLYSAIHLWPADHGKGFDREAWDRTKDKCDNPGCAEVATVFYERLKRYTKTGDELVPSTYANEYRQFCVAHRHRGDCGLDDADHNYKLIDKPDVTP